MALAMDALRYDEQVILNLRALYRQYGYTQYRMSRFEEYGLYSDNKSFLASGEIITFTGAGGKLMALRPDVTLSIVKNTRESDGLKKLYYNENVYRPDGREFKEQMQAGLECIGELDHYLVGEVLMLAKRSLELLGEHSCIDVSHMGVINGMLQNKSLTPAQKAELMRRISEKNAPELNALCAEYGLDSGFRDRITRLSALYGPIGETIPELRRLCVNEEAESALCELEVIQSVLNKLGAESGVNIDFTIINDISYYSGVIFQGFIEGIPTKVLSGGRYDMLLRKFGKRSGAVGFAINLDLLETLSPQRSGMEVDVLLLYDDKTDVEKLADAVNSLSLSGQSVRAQREVPGEVKYTKTVEM